MENNIIFDLSGVSSLKDIPLKDIYIGRESSLITGVPGTNDPIPAPASCAAELSELRSICEQEKSKQTRDEFPIRHNQVSYRVSVLISLTDTVFVLRRSREDVSNLMDLNIREYYVDLLMRPRISGLIIVSGAYGQGKTTTASSIIASRLRKYGGVAITIEDPPEMPLEGPHGEGHCYQTWVDKGGFGEACRRAARWAPSIIFLGEVRDQESAQEALKASINGRLVICTTHADSVPTAVERIYSLANGNGTNPDDNASLLASGLLCVMHQKLEGEPKKPYVEFMWAGNDLNEKTAIVTNISNRKWAMLKSEVQFQQNKMNMENKTRK